MRPSVLAVALVGLAASCSVSYAHMEMVDPPPRDSKYIPASLAAGLNIDYTNSAPLGGPRPYPCGHNKGPIVANWKAGSPINVQIGGGAPHDGGHCQFAISYDNAVTFVVLKTVVRECLRGAGLNYQVDLPATAPSSKSAVFAWTWINAVGNREYYMNCADVTIDGTAGGSITGPQLFVANISPSPVVIPEFPGADGAKYDGREYLTARPTITVTADKPGPGIFTGQGVTAVPAPAPGPAPATPPPAAAPAPAPAAPAPAPAATGSTCTEGDLQCQTSVSARSFRQCSQNTWITQSCPLNTACKQSLSNKVECILTSGAAAAAPPAGATNQAAGGACTPGAYQCLVGSQFRQCDGSGNWVIKNCQSNLVCRQYGTDVVCDWP